MKDAIKSILPDPALNFLRHTRGSIHDLLDSHFRSRYPSIYKLVRFGRKNINTPAYWDKIYSNDHCDRNYEELFDNILKRIPYGTKVLDVGCGVGILAALMRAKRGAVVTGLDFSAKAIELLANEGFDTVISVLPMIPLQDNSFDVAVATETLEHLDAPETTLSQMIRVVRTDGIVMCSVPNNSLHPHEELEHQHSFDENTFKRLLSKCSAENEIIKVESRKGVQHRWLLGCIRVCK